MVLVCDIGNSTIGFCVYQATGAPHLSFQLATDRNKSSDEYAVTLDSLFRMNSFSPDDLTGAIIGSVVPDLTATVSRTITILSGITPMSVGPGIKTSLDIKTDNPGEVGADIVANAVAALAEFPAPLIIADFATATTIVTIDSNKRLTDVYILPGVYSSYAALTRDAAEIPCVPLFTPKNLSAKNTAASVNTGVLCSAAYALDGFVAQIAKNMGVDSLPVIATGGAAELVLPLCRTGVELREYLTCDGLYRIYLKNRTN